MTKKRRTLGSGKLRPQDSMEVDGAVTKGFSAKDVGEECGELTLDKSPLPERICGDAHDLGPVDVQRLCRIWAEVGRAILVRRKQAGEEYTNTW